MMTLQKPSNISVSESGSNILTELKSCLQEKRDRIYEEISIYPSPIPACDVQFNHLLEERTKLSKELNLVDALLAQCYTGSVKNQALKELIAFSNHIDDEMVERLEVIFMTESHRAIAREIAHQYLEAGDPLGWFEELYATARGDASIIPWADLSPNPNLLVWLDAHCVQGQGKKALKVGCGLGDDAEELESRGFDTTAFDISLTAIDWCRKRFPNSSVHYVAADLFKAPRNWVGGFDFVLESYTLQVLPLSVRIRATAEIASFVKPGGTLLVICRGRDLDDPEGKMPWPLTKEDLDAFKLQGLKEVAFEDYRDKEDPPVRRMKVAYCKPEK